MTPLEKVLKRTGYTRLLAKHGKAKKRARANFPDLKVEHSIPTSDKIEANGIKKDPLAYKWQKGKEEKIETIRKTEHINSCSAPLYNKGAYQYVTPKTDVKTIGRK